MSQEHEQDGTSADEKRTLKSMADLRLHGFESVGEQRIHLTSTRTMSLNTFFILVCIVMTIFDAATQDALGCVIDVTLMFLFAYVGMRDSDGRKKREADAKHEEWLKGRVAEIVADTKYDFIQDESLRDKVTLARSLRDTMPEQDRRDFEYVVQEMWDAHRMLDSLKDSARGFEVPTAMIEREAEVQSIGEAVIDRVLRNTKTQTQDQLEIRAAALRDRLGSVEVEKGEQ